MVNRKSSPANPSPESRVPSPGSQLPIEPYAALARALSRDQDRLRRLLSAWQKRPDDAAARQAFESALSASIAARQARAASVPAASVDQALPIAREAERIVELIGRHRVLVVAGETGSGKTTQLPKLCLAAGRGVAGMIGCTQPRRIAARSMARRVAQELGVEPGGAVGYQVRFTERVSERSLIKFMTDGILLAETASNRFLSAYDTLIVDEAHERSLNIDFLLGYLKRLLKRRDDLKLIVTSATIDTERFARFFDGAPVVEVEGRGYPVEVRYRPFRDSGLGTRDSGESAGASSFPPPIKAFEGRLQRESSAFRRPAKSLGPRFRGGDDALLFPESRVPSPESRSSDSLDQGIAAAIDEISAADPRGDVLVFLPGEREIRDAHLLLTRRQYRATEILPLYARLSARDQDRVFAPGPGRRIVLATNVAETSLTVPRIRYVVDPGLARIKRYSPRGKLDRLHIEPISQASAEQRKGRCGRIAAGVCYRLYSEADFAARPAYTDPEIRRASLAGVILRMLSLGLGRVEDFPFLEPPDPRAIADGWQQLAELGAVDTEHGLSPIGRQMARLPVDPKLARMLVAAEGHGCLAEMCAIAAFLGIQDPRERPADARQAADAAHAEFADPKSEFVAMLRLWDAYRQAHEDLTQSRLREWCGKRFLNFLRMREWRELHRQLLLLCDELGWASDRAREPSARAIASARPRMAGQGDLEASASRQGGQPHALSEATYAALHRALIAGLPGQLGHKTDKGLYEGPRGRKFQLFPGSPLAKKPPPWVLSATLLETQKIWGVTNAAIEPDWAIAELPHLLARRHFDPHWSRAQGRVIGSEQISLFGLVLAPRRPVHYGGLYPQEAREIFVRQGLLPGEVNTRAAFVARNLATLEKAREEEAKRRRAGLVADEDWQARWYLDRLPAEVNGIAALEKWYGTLDAGGRRALEWTLADLLPGEGAEADRFPKYLAVGAARLRLSYRFEPGADDDGATLEVPLHLLGALDAARLSWLVPGLVHDKVQALIRGLPKALRRNFVPAPEFARAFVEAFPRPGADALTGELARFLRRLTGVEVGAGDFDEAALEPHLRMNLRLYEREGGPLLAQSRDLDALRARFRERAERAFADQAGAGLARDELREFPRDPIPETVPGAAGVPAYPALVDSGLVDAGQTAALQVFADRNAAAQAHPRGVRRLLEIALADAVKQARRQLPVPAKTGLLYAAIESVDRLRADLVQAALDGLLAEGLEAIRDREAFERRRDTAGKRLFAEAVERLKSAETILDAVAALRPALEPPLLGWARGNLDDLREQLAGLVHPGFLRQTPAAALAEYPRYLEAMRRRAERAQRDPARDQARMLDLAPFVQALAAARTAGRDRLPEWQALRWDLEELRVSLFAQELGARGQVSVKRMARRLREMGK